MAYTVSSGTLNSSIRTIPYAITEKAHLVSGWRFFRTWLLPSSRDASASHFVYCTQTQTHRQPSTADSHRSAVNNWSRRANMTPQRRTTTATHGLKHSSVVVVPIEMHGIEKYKNIANGNIAAGRRWSGGGEQNAQLNARRLRPRNAHSCWRGRHGMVWYSRV